MTQQWTAHRPTEDEARDVALARDGDTQAFERLYRLHVGRIHGLARRMAGVEMAEDLTQDVFVRAWEKLPSFRHEAQFGTWLYRLAINVVVEHFRKSAVRPRLEGDEDALRNLACEAPNAAFGMDFDTAVSRLPDGARMVFLLHDVEGYKHREIGKMVGITSGTSKGQLHRARSILRRFLSADVRRPMSEVDR